MNINDLVADVRNEVPRTYRDLLKVANLTREEIRDLHQIRDRRAMAHFLGAVATTAAVPLLFLAFPHPLMAVVCVLLTIHNFNSFAQVVHVSGHGKLLSKSRRNDIVGDIAAAFLGFVRRGHALSHQLHHIKLNTEEDPDNIWGRPEESTREIFRSWLQDVLAISAAKRLLQYAQFDRKSYKTTPWQGLTPDFFMGKIFLIFPVAMLQLALVAYYWAVIGPQFYFYFYVLPILTLYPAQIRLRTACEHLFDAGYEPRSPEERWVVRSTQANLFERFLLVPLFGEYHFEHHLLPGVPYYNLPLARRILTQRGLQVLLAPGYFAFLYRRWREERRLDRRAEAT